MADSPPAPPHHPHPDVIPLHRTEPWVTGEGGGPAGWFDFAPLYDRLVDTAPPGATLVEVGVFCGLSLSHLAKRARDSGKGLTVVGVDTFRGSPEHAAAERLLPRGYLSREAWRTLDAAGVLDHVVLVTADSTRAADLFDDYSLHAVFIDADHSFESVTADLTAWWSKVRFGGIIAGHDYHTHAGVRLAVNRFFADHRPPWPESQSWWEFRKGGSNA